MITKFIEAHDAAKFNWGKFAICKWELEEWSRMSVVDEETSVGLLHARGWSKHHIWVLDIQTGEGFCTTTDGSPTADLNKHKVWVCPMFEPFLAWLYEQDLTDLEKLPSIVDLGDVPTAMAGYRREGGNDGAEVCST